MAPTGKVYLAIAAGFFAALAPAQNNAGNASNGTNASPAYDQYNPQMRRDQQPPRTPSVADMGFGTDEGNMGPFVTISDKQFARITAVRAAMETQLAREALRKSNREDVKKLANLMLDDADRWGPGIVKASAYLKIALPQGLNGKQQAEIDHVRTLTGSAFDDAYLREVIRLQDKELTVTRYEASNAGVTGFRHWSGVMVPKLMDEIETAKRALNENAVVTRK